MKELISFMSSFVIVFTLVYTIKIAAGLIATIRSRNKVLIPFGDTSCLVYALYLLGWLLMLS